jgi:hypothetical protein
MILLFLLASPVLLQDAPAGNPPVDSGKVESLRGRIHEMRMNLLLGGDKVRAAENDATQFYRGKVELIEKRLDSVAAELAELRATYAVSLEHALAGGEAEQRKSTLSDAAAQRGKIAALETEEIGLAERRSRLEKLVAAVEARSRQRDRLTAQLETEPGFDEGLAFPLGGIGLAPELEVLAPSSPLEDPGLIADLIARDPVAAHRLLFETDPAGYWELFPLQPPADAVRRELEFPLADLPGQR